MQHRAADKLHVVVHHIPCNLVAAGHPVVLVVGFVALDVHAVAGGAEVAVVVGGGHLHHLVLGKSASRLLDHRESLGQDGVEHFLRLLIRCLLEMFNALVQFLFLFDRHVILVLDTFFQLSQLGLFRLYLLADTLLEFEGFGSQLVIGQLMNLRIRLEARIQVGFHLFEVSVGLSAE